VHLFLLYPPSPDIYFVINKVSFVGYRNIGIWLSELKSRNINFNYIFNKFLIDPFFMSAA